MSENKSAVVHPEENGIIHISEDVIASIVALAAAETDGVASLAAGSPVDWNELLGKKHLTKGVKLVIDGSTVAAEVFILVKYGFSVTAVAEKVQNNVKSALFSMAGLESKSVNVHVCGVFFEKEKGN